VLTIRTAICYYYRLTIVAAQQDSKRPFSLARIVLMSVAAIIIRQQSALAYAPRSVLNLDAWRSRRGRHGLGPSGGWDEQKPEKTTRSPKMWIGNLGGDKRAMQVFVRWSMQSCVLERRSVERRLALEKWTRLHGES
jgi:hypothetical protein